MNVVREIQKLNERELEAGISAEASWHAEYKDSAWVFAGNLDYRLTEGDITTVFSQFGEIDEINLVRDKDTGKSKGFAYIKYTDQRSTVLAVDNFVGVSLLDRVLRVDHVKRYRRPEPESKPEEFVSRGPIEGRQDDISRDLDGAGVKDKRERSRSESPEEPSEDERERMALKLGLDVDDPMREYLIDKALSKQKKHKEKKKKKHKRSKRKSDE